MAFLDKEITMPALVFSLLSAARKSWVLQGYSDGVEGCLYDKVHGPGKGTSRRLLSTTVLHSPNEMSVSYSVLNKYNTDYR